MDRGVGHFSLERVGFGENSYRVSSPRNAFDKSRSIFFFFFYFALVRLAPPPPHRSPRHSLLHEFHDFFLVHASARPSHALHHSTLDHRIRFSGNFQLKTFSSPPSPQRWNSRYFKIPLFSFHFWKIRSLSEKYLFLPRSFRRDKETKDVYKF